MRITLSNFKCYSKKSFDFGTSGLVLLSGSSGAGKCMGKDTPILMYDGSIKKVQHIKRGDKLMGDDSNPRTVLSTCSGVDDLYQIKPMEGDPYIVNSTHILTLKGASPEIYYDSKSWNVEYTDGGARLLKRFDRKRDAEKFISKLPENPIIDMCVKKYLSLEDYHKNMLYTYHTGVEFPEKRVDVDPYSFGYKLMNNVSIETRIPENYKINNRTRRMLLLYGMIMSDYCVSDDAVYLYYRSREFAEDIKYLCLSLGFMAVITDYNYVRVTGDLPRFCSSNKNAVNHRFSITKLPAGEYFGFEIDGNGRYLLGDFKVTHNTSVLQGINFAFFGTGCNLIMDGKSSCKVELNYKDITIIRTKRPNRLLLIDKGCEYEDDAAQSIIDRIVGENFKTSGYVSQSAIDSFVLMTPTQKLEFLEGFAFGDVNISEIKLKCKKIINERKTTLSNTISKLELAIGMVSELKEPTQVKFPLPGVSIRKRKRAIKNEMIRHKNAGVLLARATSRRARLIDEKNERIRLNDVLTEKGAFIEEYNNELEGVNSAISNSSFIGDEKLEYFKGELARILKQKELVEIRKTYDRDVKRLSSLKKEEVASMESEIEDSRSIVWKKYSKKDVTTQIESLRSNRETLLKIAEYRSKVSKLSCIKDIEKLQSYKEQRADLERKMAAQQMVYDCPQCSSKLQLMSDSLCVFTDNVEQKTKVGELTRQLSKLSSRIDSCQKKVEKAKLKTRDILVQIEELEGKCAENSIEAVEARLDELTSYKAENKKIEKRINFLKNNLENNIFSSTIQKLEADTKRLERRLGENITPTTTSMDEEELRGIISENVHQKKVLSVNKSNAVSIQRKIDSVKSSISLLNAKYVEAYGGRALADITSDLETITEDIRDLETKKRVHDNNVIQIDRYNKYIEEQDIYENWQNKVDELRELETTHRKSYGAAVQMKDIILKAESVALSNIIGSINMHAKQYLDCFFQNDPIEVILTPYRQTKDKKQKSQISMIVNYKNMQSTTKILSGGELSRVVLAFSLALGEMFNTPLMLLDESTASLDEKLTNTVIEGIKNNYEDKLVIMIAHQCVEGVFDKVIKLVE